MMGEVATRPDIFARVYNPLAIANERLRMIGVPEDSDLRVVESADNYSALLAAAMPAAGAGGASPARPPGRSNNPRSA
jgi:hypothetical protein